MENEKNLSEIEEAALALIKNTEENIKENNVEIIDKEVVDDKDDKAFKKYKIKDIVFLAIITGCTLITGAVMPLLVNVPLFGIVQLGLGLQFSIFPVIGMMKVRKAGSLFFQSLFISVFLIFMFPPMALIVFCGIIAEALSLLIFHGYKNDWACVLSTTIYMPLTLPLMYIYYNAFYTVKGDEKKATSMFLAGTNIGVMIGISIAVVALCFVGSVVGMLISRELKKAGVLKK